MANVLHMTKHKKYKNQYIYTTVLKFGFGKDFMLSFLCSQWLHLIKNTVKAIMLLKIITI